MRFGTPDPKDLGRYAALSQVGLEMVVPVGIGLLLDNYLGWTPWLTVAGVVLGFVGGLTHLVLIVNKQDRTDQRDNSPPPHEHPPEHP